MHMYEYVFHKFYNSQISISQVYNSQILAHERSLEKVIFSTVKIQIQIQIF